MATNYGMNGRVGRAKTLRSIRKEREARARAAGVDTTDRKAMKAFRDAEFNALMRSIEDQIAKNRASRA